MKFLLFCSFLYSGVYAIAQDTIEVVKFFPNTEQLSARYYVLKSDTSVKHGAYIDYFPMTYAQRKGYHGGLGALERFVKHSGRYQLGQRDGFWKIYSAVEVLAEEGMYRNGEKVDVWKVYTCPKWIVESFDYSKKEWGPSFLPIAFNYPYEAKAKGLSGMVYFTFSIKSDCSIGDFKVTSTPDESFSSAVLKQLEDFKKMPSKPCQCQERVTTSGAYFKAF